MNDAFRIVLCMKTVKENLFGASGANDTEEYQINPYDLKALVLLSEYKKTIDFTLTCICMGPEKCADTLKRAYALGADEIVLITDKELCGSDTVATTYILSEAIKKLNNTKLVICGEKAIDGETGQVPVGLCERLGYRAISGFVEILGLDQMGTVMKRKYMNRLETVKMSFPGVAICQVFETKMPLISLMDLKRARRRDVTVLDAPKLRLDISRCGINGSKTRVVSVRNSFPKKSPRCIEGTSEEKAGIITDLIRGRCTDKTI